MYHAGRIAASLSAIMSLTALATLSSLTKVRAAPAVVVRVVLSMRILDNYVGLYHRLGRISASYCA